MCRDVSSVDGESSNSNCSYRDLYQFLKSEGVGTNIMIRPVKNHTSPTVAELLAQIYSVLDVVSVFLRL